MNLTWHHLLELVAIAFAASSTLWVLVVQPVGLVGSMPRARFLGFQMRVVRVWVRALVPLTAAVLAMALVRAGASRDALPGAAAFAGAALAASWALPRALRAGGLAAREDDVELTAERFLSEGGGAGTRVWHRVVLACVALVLAGLGLDARDALAQRPAAPCAGCDHHAPSGAAAPAHPRPTVDLRTPAPEATWRAVRDFDREVRALASRDGVGDAAPLRAAWGRIFSGCTMQGEAHARLHAFLEPLMEAMARFDAADAPTRLASLRAMQAQLATFESRFVLAR